MSDDKMDELLAQAARDYNAPGSLPREEMWARIAEARRAAPPSTSIATRRPSRSMFWAYIAAAAVIVLGIGFGIGRSVERARPAPPITVAQQPDSPPPVAAQLQDSGITAAVLPGDTIVPQLREETRRTGRRAQELASAARGAGVRAEPDLAYRLVMLRHVAGSEAMITAFRASALRGEVDAQLAGWARELLSTTRLLEASPVAQDPIMRRLLEDLDLVMVQITQYVTRGTVDTEELEFIEQSINKRSVMTKLRSTLPGRNAPAGT